VVTASVYHCNWMKEHIPAHSLTYIQVQATIISRWCMQLKLEKIMHILAMVRQLRKDIPLAIAWAHALSVQLKPSEVAMLECDNGWRHIEPHILKISQKLQGHRLECGPSRITHHLCSSSQQHEHGYAITRDTLTSYWRCIRRDGWIDICHSKANQSSQSVNRVPCVRNVQDNQNMHSAHNL
jgi:hypothetical protein